MNAKTYLSQAMWLDIMINQKLEEQERLKAMAEKVTSNFSEVKVSGGERKNTREESNVKLIDLRNETNEITDRYIDLRNEIMETINQLEEMNYRLILEMRYISKKGWDEIAATMGYDVRWIMELHGRALKKVDKILRLQKTS